VALQAWFDRANQPRTAGSRAALVGAPGISGLSVTPSEWLEVGEDLAAAGARLLALWAGPGEGRQVVVRAVYLATPGPLVVSLELAGSAAEYPGLDTLFPCASRMQRAVADLSGPEARAEDTRPWLRHAAWPADFLPLDRTATPPLAKAAVSDPYAFVPVAGDGVHEIAVGPVHAGIIEPGHFRFSVVGEKVLRLEERLGYVHKGIERRFTELSAKDGHYLAARVSGDSAVAFSWAYCQALEGLANIQIPTRATYLRALALELERLANHLGDLGALGNDAGFAFGLAQFSRLKELLLRANERAFGQRYLLDFVVPGGTRTDLSDGAQAPLGETVVSIRAEVETLRTIYEEHAGLRDRFVGAGTVTPAIAARLGLIGLAGRASGQAYDLRCDQPCDPYHELAPQLVQRTEGDVAARVTVRFDEVRESVRLIARTLQDLPPGNHLLPLPIPRSGTLGIGLIEGWRGPVLVALELDSEAKIRRCHPHDPSWQNWPLLEHAIIDNIVPDFPLINKSFNLSYSGHDL